MKTVTSYDQAIENIRKFNEEVESYPNNNPALKTLVNNIPHYRAWYCMHDVKNDKYYFAPSKYIGYRDIDSKTYAEFNRDGLDGRKTESTLSAWFETISINHILHDKLTEQLMEFCSQFGKKPNSLFRINIPLNKPEESSLEANVIEFIWNAYQNLSDEGRNEVKNKINRYKPNA
ncbi:hypothetical protein [Photobacterium kasasachensis]|uniref:hypothetical protein n=1 Tax=Photobacterium kasasachensis TaxID=2910240 RepID=UPI003D0DE7F0